MWISVVFDLPSVTAADRKSCRCMRKKLLSAGFIQVQKSLLWRWAENKEFADALVKKLKKSLPDTGNIIFFYIPDTAFKHTLHTIDGKVCLPPSPPDPWIILS